MDYILRLIGLFDLCILQYSISTARFSRTNKLSSFRYFFILRL